MPRPQQSTALDADVLAGARAASARVTPRQLKRWRHEGLLPSPLFVRGKGRGQGVEAHYPPVAPLQAAVVAGLLQRVRSVPFVRWTLWGFGFDDVTEGVRADLRTMLREEWDSYRARFSDHERDDRVGVAPSALEAWVHPTRRRPAHLGRVVRRVGRARASTYVAYEHALRLGTLSEKDVVSLDRYDAALFASAVDAVNGAPRVKHPAPPEDHNAWRGALLFVARLLSFEKIDDVLRTCPPGWLCQLRNEVDTLARHEGLVTSDIDDVPPASWFLRWFVARSALGEWSDGFAAFLDASALPRPQSPPFLRRMQVVARKAKRGRA